MTDKSKNPMLLKNQGSLCDLTFAGGTPA